MMDNSLFSTLPDDILLEINLFLMMIHETGPILRVFRSSFLIAYPLIKIKCYQTILFLVSDLLSDIVTDSPAG